MQRHTRLLPRTLVFLANNTPHASPLTSGCLNSDWHATTYKSLCYRSQICSPPRPQSNSAPQISVSHTPEKQTYFRLSSNLSSLIETTDQAFATRTKNSGNEPRSPRRSRHVSIPSHDQRIGRAQTRCEATSPSSRSRCTCQCYCRL